MSLEIGKFLRSVPLRESLIATVAGVAIACAQDKDAEPFVDTGITPEPSPTQTLKPTPSLTPRETISPTPELWTPTQTPTLAPTPTLEPTPTPVPEPTPLPIPTPVYVEALDTWCNTRLWNESDIPTSIYIPTIGNIENIEQLTRDPENNDNYNVPQRNLASAADARENTNHLFTHYYNVFTEWQIPFSNIQYLNLDDFIIPKNQNEEAFCFRVSDFALTGSIEKDPAKTFGPFDIPTFIIQASERGRRGEYYLDEENISRKVGENKPVNTPAPTFVSDPNSTQVPISSYRALLVYATQKTTFP